MPPGDTPAAGAQSRAERLNTRAAGVVGLAVLCSRVLGLAREQIFAALFGGGRVMDAFTIAFRIPNLLRDLFAEGALSTAFVTVFTRTAALEDDAAAWRLADKVATLAAVCLSAITVLGIITAPCLVAALAPGFDADKAALTVTLTRVMYPFILLVSLAALVMGMLNARNVFGMPAMASSFFNLGSIVAGVLLGYWLDPQFGPRAILGLPIGTLVGGALQLGGQLPGRPPHPPGARAGQLSVRLAARGRPDVLADGGVSPDAVAAGSLRRRARHRGAAAAGAHGGDRPHRGGSQRACARHAACVSHDHSGERRSHGARRAHHLGALPARPFRGSRDGGIRGGATLLRHRAVRLRRAEGAGERLLRARPAQDTDGGQFRRGGSQPAVELDLHRTFRLGASRAGVLHRLRSQQQLPHSVPPHALTPRAPGIACDAGVAVESGAGLGRALRVFLGGRALAARG